MMVAMNYYKVCPIGIIGGKEDLLTYSFEHVLSPGAIVAIPFGKKTKQGVIWRAVAQPDFTTKDITDVYDDQLPLKLMDLASWISDYYAARLSLVLQTILPSGIGTKRRGELAPYVKTKADDFPPLTKEQTAAVMKITQSSSITTLLHGVTGSGKTRVYQELAVKALAGKKSVLILVPEIALTPQLAERFAMLTDNILVLHSRLTNAQRHLAWQKLRSATEPWVVIGPRSALFAPLDSIGLIVIDECHEPSFVQDSQPKYSALRVARKLADLHPGTKLILGSATPNINDYYTASETNTPIIELKQPVQKYQREVTLVDSRQRDGFTSHPLFGNQLMGAMKRAVETGEQILLFHNRRATARVALCAHCGWSAECKNCHVPMRLHHDTHELKCHICGLQQPLPNHCPQCKQPDIEFKGFGSKRIEQEVRKLFPQASVARFDSDTPEKEQLHHRFSELIHNEIDIIIGTQGLAKGLDLPALSTIGVVSSDTELHVPDFSSSERAFQLISQVIGRAGRKGQKSQVFIQTFNPDHSIILSAKNQDYHTFYQHELENRKAGHLPPFTFLLQLQIGYKQAATAEAHAEKLKQELKKSWPLVTVRGPTPSFQAYRAGNHFVQLVVSSQKREVLKEIARSLPQKWQFTLDPINLM